MTPEERMSVCVEKEKGTTRTTRRTTEFQLVRDLRNAELHNLFGDTFTKRKVENRKIKTQAIEPDSPHKDHRLTVT